MKIFSSIIKGYCFQWKACEEANSFVITGIAGDNMSESGAACLYDYVIINGEYYCGSALDPLPNRRETLSRFIII